MGYSITGSTLDFEFRRLGSSPGSPNKKTMELNNKKTKKKINYVSRVPLKLVALFESLAV